MTVNRTDRDISKTVTISNATSLSGAVSVGHMAIAGVIVPSAWTAAAITFQAVLADGTTYGNVFDETAEVSIASGSVAANNVVMLSQAAREKLRGLNSVKLRSGTSGTPVNQGADRTIRLILES